jgi:uncharacterized protein YfkK (UPF0435 family)
MPDADLLVFISHSSKDAELALALVNLLRAGFGLLPEQIRCSSVDGYRLQVGAYTENVLRQEVNVAKVVIGLITPNSLASYFVTFELGGRWGAGQFLAPLLCGIKPEQLSAPLNLLHTLSAHDEIQLHQLLENISKRIEVPLQNEPSYAHFIKNIKISADRIRTNKQITAMKRIAIVVVISITSMALGYLVHGKEIQSPSQAPSNAAPTRTLTELRLIDLNSEIRDLRGDYEALHIAANNKLSVSQLAKKLSVNTAASQLVKKMNVLNDGSLSPGMQALKYEHLSYAWAMVAETQSGSKSQMEAAQLEASQGILGACDTAKAIISAVKSSAPFNKKAQDTWDWMIKDEIESRIGRLSAVGLCVRWQVNHNPSDARDALEIIDHLPNNYLVKEEPENSPELMNCLRAAFRVKASN